VSQAVKKGSVRFDWLDQRPEGTLRDRELYLLWFEAAGWNLLQSTLQEIAESRRAEMGLSDSERRPSQAQKLAHVGSWEHNPTAGLILWSDEIYRIFEVDPATFKVTMESFFSIVHPDDRAWMHEAYKRSELTRQPFDLVYRLLMPDGRVKHV